jgi:hypothetical protein
VPEAWLYPDEIQAPAINVIEKPDEWPAEQYYVSTIDIIRKFMGTGRQVGNHQLWAEAAINPRAVKDLDLDKVRRVLIIHKPESDREAGEIVRTARALAFDMGFLCGFDSIDMFSLEALRASRMQSFFFPTEKHRLTSTAVTKVKAMGCVPVYIRLLPEQELKDSQVGVPKFWRKNGRNVDMSELRGKVAVVVSSNEYEPIDEDDICVSVPIAVSPLGPAALATMDTIHAAVISMTAIVGLDQESKLSQPSVLEPTHIAEIEGQMVTKALASKLGIPRPLTTKQLVMAAKKKAKREFELQWEREEAQLAKRDTD